MKFVLLSIVGLLALSAPANSQQGVPNIDDADGPVAHSHIRRQLSKSGKGAKSFHIPARGTAEATINGITGVASDQADTIFGTQWTVNTGTSADAYKEFDARNDPATAVPKGYLQYFYDEVIPNDGPVTPISSTEFRSFSYDIYPIECGAAENPAGSNSFGHSFFASIRFVHKLTADGGTCGFYDCSFDYELLPGVESGPEGQWTTITIGLDTLPWRVRAGGSGCSCPITAAVSINTALQNPTFPDMILGTGYGEIASLNMGAAVGGADYNLHGCFDNVVFNTSMWTKTFDFEPSNRK
ncbi:hypothetical protein HJC23_011478 [Cyclotella cryptica]|uniref:Uncharacterized protein n=1 Tax=Cyclotella cryptica TaxID=29204 RepID=A0ABD3NF63_9STRA|eukprot:CCRYP_021213-RA/>CCRYP_021213-RA protein AED:0.28 eAED:0.29 QI:0/0/0/1/1/1/2/0/297